MGQTDRYKLKQLILYIVHRMREAPYFGSTKLNKVLYRSEFAAFRELGYLLTGFHYKKNTHGPTLRAYLPITAEMESEGLIRSVSVPQGQWEETRPFPLVDYDDAALSASERALVDQEIQRAYSLTGRQMSEEEHQTAVWFATPMGQNIPPELAFVEDPEAIMPLDGDKDHWAARAIARYQSRTRTL